MPDGVAVCLRAGFCGALRRGRALTTSRRWNGLATANREATDMARRCRRGRRQLADDVVVIDAPGSWSSPTVVIRPDERQVNAIDEAEEKMRQAGYRAGPP